MKLLKNHISPETAYVVEDYPYGFRLRCKIRYWMEYRKNKGVRFCSQTTNPKSPTEVWNKPKYTTYSIWGGAMYVDEAGHVQFTGVNEYYDLRQMLEWYNQFQEANHSEIMDITKVIIRKKFQLDKAKVDGRVIITVGQNTTVLKPELDWGNEETEKLFSSFI